MILILGDVIRLIINLRCINVSKKKEKNINEKKNKRKERNICTLTSDFNESEIILGGTSDLVKCQNHSITITVDKGACCV